MDKERWTRVREIFTHLSDQSSSFRKQYLDMVCEDQLDLRHEVEKMLRAYDVMSSHPTTVGDTQKLPDNISGYRVTGLLGRGGMSTVYAAEHEKLGRVALKVLPAHLVSHPVATERFKQEALLLQKIDHPALCQVYEICIEDQYALIAMEYGSGSTLAVRLRDERFNLRLSLQVAQTISEVLVNAHRQGVVHRDLKPSNVILDDHNRTKLIDFGIAKFADVNLTATGEVIGSPAYMSPEQWRGEPIGPETDAWSLGVVLYEMVTGVTPFAADTVGDTADLVTIEHST